MLASSDLSFVMLDPLKVRVLPLRHVGSSLIQRAPRPYKRRQLLEHVWSDASTGTMVREFRLASVVFCIWVPSVFVVDSQLIRRFLFSWACESGTGGVGSSACLRFYCRVPEVCYGTRARP